MSVGALRRVTRRAMASLLLGLAAMTPSVGAADDEAARYIEFVREDGAQCVARNGVRLMVRSTHPSRTVRVWLDRYFMGNGTGDRSRTDLKPGAEPEPLGCSKSSNGDQEWRVVRAQFVD